MVISAMVLAGCNGSGNGNDEANNTDKPVIELGYSHWACANANSHMVKALLEEKFDVEVNLRVMDLGLMWQSLATGDIDFMVTAWLPVTHGAFKEELKDDVVDLGPLYEGAKLGLVVPQYVTIDSIEELNENADKFGGRIVGIDAGSGIMKMTNQAIADYNLNNMELLQSSDAGMTTELKAAYDQEEWIVVTGWAPHWMFGAFDLKFLEDPDNIYGDEETINVSTKKGFADEYPEINEFLDNYYLSVAEFGSLIDIMEQYEDDNEAASAWIEQNRELVDSWFE